MNARNSSYNFQNVSNGVKSELLHLREQALMGWNKEYRTGLTSPILRCMTLDCPAITMILLLPV